MLTFISQYPDKDSIKDGMMQRINSIDESVSSRERVYLSISYKKNIKKKIVRKERLTIYYVNYIIHQKFIKKILEESKEIYIHSIYNFNKVANNSKIVMNKSVTLDFHGVVPEELEFCGKKILSKKFSKIELKACLCAKKIVFVTKSMESYIINKYKNIQFESIVYPIISQENFKSDDKFNVELTKKELGIKEDDTVFIYSGNCQEWQNIDLMLTSIEKNIDCKNFKFIILTGDTKAFEENPIYQQIKGEIILKSVLPSELSKYYSISNYGFVLRDEHILNKVACPTKIVEYMQNGIIPIVKSEEIGDFLQLGYEFIRVDDINNKLSNKKSDKNKLIIENIIELKKKTKVI
ncbi:hypothetical protein KPL40_11955 [Clostridium gasigenes]|uniref:hypothetical protein n=1 Tax=Clostridium gasigenes TaxID=94869 RepID=UPI001C0D8BB4|nr:hypothetical protein [Clostridium gasigenes]MBU3133163.1 hypothetical protein [Clostridium gasigenes]